MVGGRREDAVTRFARLTNLIWREAAFKKLGRATIRSRFFLMLYAEYRSNTEPLSHEDFGNILEEYRYSKNDFAHGNLRGRTLTIMYFMAVLYDLGSYLNI